MRNSQDNLSVVLLGSDMTIAYFSELIYNDKPTSECLGRKTYSETAASVEKATEDLTIIEDVLLFSDFLNDNGFFVSPRVDFAIDTSDSFEQVISRMHKSKRKRLRHIADSGYSFELTKDPEKLKWFYHEMYLPHVLARHDKSAFPVSFAECQDLFSQGDLLLVRAGQEYLSGALVIPRGNELWEPIYGVTNVSTDLTLGSYAVYYFTILSSVQKGFARVDFGESAPFVQDGVFQFKRDMGMQIRLAKDANPQVFGLKFSKMSESVKNFLSTNPFIFLDGGMLNCLVFQESLSDVYSACYVPGLSNVYVVSSHSDWSICEGFKLSKVSLQDNLSAALKWMSRICSEGKYSLYRLSL